MWSKQEAKSLRQQFWTALGQYMAPIPSAEGERIHWINYKTGNKAVRLRLHEEKGWIQTIISVETADADLSNNTWEQMLAHQTTLVPVEKSAWQWDQQQTEISCSLAGINILQQGHWPQAIAFFKQSLITADRWWCSFKYNLPNTEIDF